MGFLTTLAPGALLCLALLQDAPSGALAQAWKDTWADLARFADTAPAAPEHARLWRELDGFQVRHERSARKSDERAEAFRARLLRAQLSRLSGVAFRPVAEPGGSPELLPGEAWIALQVLGPGPTRAACLSKALAEAGERELAPRVGRAIEVAEEDARLLHLEWALVEARAIHARAPAARTAGLLAGILRQRGDEDAAAQVLAEALPSARTAADRAALLAERGRVNAARNADAFGDLGAALASGSEEAGLRLACRALSEGEPGRARALCRSLLERDAPRAGALRAYGLALLASPTPLSAAQPADPFPLEKP